MAKRNFQFQLLEELFSYSDILKVYRSLNKQFQDNLKAFQGNLPDKIKMGFESFQTDILTVAEKFIPSLKRYCFADENIDNNHEAQERIKNACKYFSDKLNQHLLSILNNDSFETDNTAIEKLINEYIKQLYEVSSIKHTCIKACFEGFILEKYLDIRAKAHFEKNEFRINKNAK